MCFSQQPQLTHLQQCRSPSWSWSWFVVNPCLHECVRIKRLLAIQFKDSQAQVLRRQMSQRLRSWHVSCVLPAMLVHRLQIRCPRPHSLPFHDHPSFKCTNLFRKLLSSVLPAPPAVCREAKMQVSRHVPWHACWPGPPTLASERPGTDKPIFPCLNNG